MAPLTTAGDANFIKKLSDVDRKELLNLTTDLVQLGLDLAGIVDPTPISDGASGLIALARGQWFDAAISGLSMIPYVGDLAKAGKLPKYLKSVERAIVFADRSADAAKALLPGMQKLDHLLGMIPAGTNQTFEAIRRQVKQFLVKHGAQGSAKLAKHFPDISHRFKFRVQKNVRRPTGIYDLKIAEGKLGVPGQVRRHRNKSAQSAVSKGTGDDAGHLIGDRFGAPTHEGNLSLQNWKTNEGGGTFHTLENDWEWKLKNGYGIEVTITDMIPSGTKRPKWRKAVWKETRPDGAVAHRELLFVNTHTQDAAHRAGSHTKQKILPTVPEGNMGKMFQFPEGGRR